MGVVVTYDVSARQGEVKSEMLRRGYHDGWTNDAGVTYHLPYSTLWKEGVTVNAALADITAAAAACGVTLERAIALPSTPWAGIPGRPS